MVEADVKVIRQPDWDAYRKGAGKATHTLIWRLMEFIYIAVKGESPVRSGRLRAMHRARLRSEDEAIIYGVANYTPYVWGGTRFYAGNPWPERAIGQTRNAIRERIRRGKFFVKD